MTALILGAILASVGIDDSSIGAKPGQPIVEDANDPAYQIGKILRCPVCQGMPVAESPSSMAREMMGRIRELQGEGKSREEILAYFVEAYGDWVLLKPRYSGVTLAVWVLPPLVVMLALGFIWRRLNRQPLSRAQAAADAADPDEDPYLARVRREVEDLS